MVGFMFFLDLVLAVLAYGLFVKKVNIIKLVVPSTLLFFMCYVVIAGILWWADSFSVLKTLVGVGLINIICIVCVIRNFKAENNTNSMGNQGIYYSDSNIIMCPSVYNTEI